MMQILHNLYHLKVIKIHLQINNIDAIQLSMQSINQYTIHSHFKSNNNWISCWYLISRYPPPPTSNQNKPGHPGIHHSHSLHFYFYQFLFLQFFFLSFTMCNSYPFIPFPYLLPFADNLDISNTNYFNHKSSDSPHTSSIHTISIPIQFSIQQHNALMILLQ